MRVGVELGRMSPWLLLCLPVLIADSDDVAWWWFP
jgi:hypothetical protein